MEKSIENAMENSMENAMEKTEKPDISDEKDIFTYLEGQFELPKTDIRTYSPLVLAYIGDGVYEIIIRTILVRRGNTKPNILHKRASRLVKASAQSEMIEIIKDELTEEEMSVYKRGRNAKSPTMAKNSTMSDYRRATGFEALIGYLYLNGETKRMIDLIKKAIDVIGE